MQSPDRFPEPNEATSVPEGTFSRATGRLWELLSDVVVCLAALAMFILAPSDSLRQSSPRLWVCLALAATTGAMAEWLLADRHLRHALFALAMMLGLSLGILWERRSGNWGE